MSRRIPRAVRLLATSAAAAATTGLAVAAAPTAAATPAGPIVGPGFRLQPGEALTSEANGYRLVMQGDGNLVQYSNVGVPLWSTGTAGRGASAMTLQSDGNLVVRTTAGTATWNSATRDGDRLAVQDDGNVVLYAGSRVAWCTCAFSFHRVVGRPSTLAAGQGMLAGDALAAGTDVVSMQPDGNLVLRTPAQPLWSSQTSAGNRSYVTLQSDGNLVVYGPDKRARWNSHTAGTDARTLTLGPDGSLRLRTAAGTVVWAVGTGATSTPPGIAADVFALLNRERAANGLPALTTDPRLVASATAHNARMSAADTLAHQLPGEPDPGARMAAAGYSWRAWAENIAWTTDTTSGGAQALQVAMYDEKPPNDGHRQNILSRAVTQVGVAVLVDSRGKLWLTTDFAAPR